LNHLKIVAFWKKYLQKKIYLQKTNLKKRNYRENDLYGLKEIEDNGKKLGK